MITTRKITTIARGGAMLLGMALVLGGAASADVHINVRNCSVDTLYFDIYNGEDNHHTFAAEAFSLDPRTGTSSFKNTSCSIGCAWLEDCEKHCQLTARRGGVKKTKDAVKVPKDHYIRVLTATHHYREDIKDMGTRITYEISDSDKLCSDPAEVINTLD